ncbi:hypothetical protein ACQ86D_33960 [Streptomyces galilaeus]
MTSNGTLFVEALATLAVLIRAYLGWAVAFIAVLTVAVLALVGALHGLYDRHKHPRKDTSP